MHWQRVLVPSSHAAWLRNINTRKCAKDTWSKVREVLKGRRTARRRHHCSLLSRLMVITLTRHRTNTTTQPNGNYQSSIKAPASQKWKFSGYWTTCGQQPPASVTYLRSTCAWQHQSSQLHWLNCSTSQQFSTDSFRQFVDILFVWKLLYLHLPTVCYISQ